MKRLLILFSLTALLIFIITAVGAYFAFVSIKQFEAVSQSAEQRALTEYSEDPVYLTPSSLKSISETATGG